MTETISCKLKQILDKLDIDILNRLTAATMMLASFSFIYFASIRVESILYLINALTNRLLPDHIYDGIVGIVLLVFGWFLMWPVLYGYMRPHLTRFSRFLYMYGGWKPDEIQLLYRIDDLFDSLNFLEENYRYAAPKDPSVTIEDIHSLRQQLAEFEAEYLKIGGPEHA